MVRAILKNGAICPLDPLPPEWSEGWELAIEGVGPPDSRPEEIDQRLQELEAAAPETDPEDDERLRVALEQAHQQAKELVRREMGLP
jgi:hypothetical protein